MLLFVLIFTSQCFAADRYIWIDSSDEITFSFDSQTIKFSTNYYNGQVDYSKMEVWIQSVYNDSGKEKIKNKHQDIKGIENFSYTLSKSIFDIKNHRVKDAAVFWYDKNGNVIFKYTNQYDTWEDVLPETYGESIEKALDSYSKDKTNRYYMEQRSK